MKVFELLRENVQVLTEEQVEARLRKFDWLYEFSDDQIRQRRGKKELELLENALYQLWKRAPAAAVRIWNQTAPGGDPAGEAVPSFLLRLEAQEVVFG